MEPRDWYNRLHDAGEQGIENADPALDGELRAMRDAAWPVRFDGRRWSAVDPRRRLHSQEIENVLHSSWLGRPLLCLNEADSTNRVAKEKVRDGCGPGTVVLAEVQTAGRGRLERQWDSPAGVGLWFSAVFRPPSLQGAPPYALLVSVGICSAIRKVPGVSAVLKWPNDVLIDGRKACGVLLEAAPDGRSLVAGVGLNVGQRKEDFPEALRSTAISLQMACGRPVDRTAVFDAVLSGIEDQVDRAMREGFGPVMDEYRTLCSTIGAWVKVEMTGRDVYGRAAGVMDNGALLLETGGNEPQAIVAGDITHLRHQKGPVG